MKKNMMTENEKGKWIVPKGLMIALIIVIGALLVMDIFLIISNVRTLVFYEQLDYHTKDINEYGKWEGHFEGEKEGLYSGLFVFPKELSDDVTDTDYYYQCSSNLWANSYEMFLKARYNKAEFDEEVKRLEAISCEVTPGNRKDIQFSNDLFEYPAYVAIYNSNGCFEYALVDEETATITYVYLQISDGTELLATEFLPKELQNTEDTVESSWDNPNIYYEKNEDGDYDFYRD